MSDLRRFESIHDELTARSGSTQRWKAAVPLFIVFEQYNRRRITVLVERIPKRPLPRKVCVLYVRSPGLVTDIH